MRCQQFERVWKRTQRIDPSFGFRRAGSHRIPLDHRRRKNRTHRPCVVRSYAPLDEDSYGYPSLEGSHANKAILTTTDSGGVTELVTDSINGYICAPEPQVLA